jgi:inner membrane protein
VLSVTHEAIGLSVGLAAATALGCGLVETAAVAAGAVIGALPADIDQPGARVHRRSRLERRHRLVGATAAPLRGAASAAAYALPHRGPTHSLFVVTVVSIAAAAVLPLPLAVGFAGGYLAHVLADGCTPGGVALLWPFSRRRIVLLPTRLAIPTNSVREVVLLIGVLALLAWWWIG